MHLVFLGFRVHSVEQLVLCYRVYCLQKAIRHKLFKVIMGSASGGKIKVIFPPSVLDPLQRILIIDWRMKLKYCGTHACSISTESVLIDFNKCLKHH